MGRPYGPVLGDYVCRTKKREQRPTVETHPVSIPITQATKSDLTRNGEPLPEETRGGAGKRSCVFATRRPDVSRNELPMTQEWQGPGQISGGSTQRAGVGSGLVFGRDCTGVHGRLSVGGHGGSNGARSTRAATHRIRWVPSGEYIRHPTH